MENEKTNMKVIKIEIIALPPLSEELGFQTGEGLEHGCGVDSGAEEVCDKINQREEIHREKCSKNGWTGVADAIETQKAQLTEEADGKTITFFKIKEEPLDIDDTRYTGNEGNIPETRNKSKGIRKGIRTSGVKPFHCSVCDKRFVSKGNHSKHMRKMHCQCSVCDQTFSNDETLLRHVQITHSKPKPYECTRCKSKFTCIGNLNKHLRVIHCQCSVCSKVFSSEDILARHIQTHRKPKSDQCTLCLKLFTCGANRQKHLRVIHYQCYVCKKVFSSEDLIARHLRTHRGRRAYGERPHSQAELRSQSDISVNERFISENGSGNLANHVSSVQEQCSDARDIGESASSHQNHGEINTDIKKECDEKRENAPIQDNGQPSHHATTQNTQCKPQGDFAGEKVFLCSMCDREFSNRGNLNKHLKLRHYQCPACNQMFSHEDVLIKHMITHQQDKPNQCALCVNKGFTTVSNLNQHVKTAHPGVVKPIYRCSYCSELFSNGDTLSRHVRMNHKCKCFQCSVCSRAFSINRSLVIHMRTHSGEKPYQCTICEKKFSHTSSLNIHLRRHTGEKPYKCKICSKDFTHWNSLAAHKLTHTGQKPYRCTICSRAFIYRNSLSAHMRTHTCNGEKSHKCSVCGNGFAHAYDLSLHMRTHPGEKPYVCAVCSKRFLTRGVLRLHMRTHMGEKPYACSFCSKSYVTKNQLKLHARTHSGEKPFQCSVCSKRFPRNGTLMEHMKVHTGETPYYCPICAKGLTRQYDLKQHMKLHDSEKSLECSVCSRGFSRMCDLKRHIQIHK